MSSGIANIHFSCYKNTRYPVGHVTLCIEVYLWYILRIFVKNISICFHLLYFWFFIWWYLHMWKTDRSIACICYFVALTTLFRFASCLSFHILYGSFILHLAFCFWESWRRTEINTTSFLWILWSEWHCFYWFLLYGLMVIL